MRCPLIYVLQSAYLYGTERMALATAEGLADSFEPTIFGPPGPALERAREMGFAVRPFTTNWQFAKALFPLLRQNPTLAFAATGVKQSAVLLAVNALCRRRVSHAHVVHGGAPDHGTYGRKWWLNYAGVTFVAVSEYARLRLVEYGVRPEKIRVIHNFLPPERIASAPRRPPFERDGVRRVVLVSRLDYLKRVSLLMDALGRRPALGSLSFSILGEGPERGRLREQAARHPNVSFDGFVSDVGPALASADLLLHTCPVETFGLVVLEAMAADLPVLVPDHGGTDLLVEEGVSGFKFRANDADHLARRLAELGAAPADVLNRAVSGGRETVCRRFAAGAALAEYRRVFAPAERDEGSRNGAHPAEGPAAPAQADGKILRVSAEAGVAAPS